MKISTSMIPSVVWYVEYTDCTVYEALLQALKNAPDNLLTLPMIWDMKVNWNRLIWSYGKAIQILRDQWYNIKTTTKHFKNHVTTSEYKLLNPDFSPSDSDLLFNI